MKRTRQAGLIGISSILLLSGALPAAASAGTLAAADAVALPAHALPALAKDSGVSASAQDAPVDTKISKDEAIKLARELGGVPDDYTMDNISFQSNPGMIVGNHPSWFVNFSLRKGDRYYGNTSVTIDSETGKLLQLNGYTNDPEKKPSYPPKTDLAAAKVIAEAYAQKLYPAEFKETRYNRSFEDGFKTPLNGEVRYNFRYDRTVNGIPYPNNGINVTVDGSGQVVEFSYSWEPDAKFAEASGVISAEKAAELLKQQSRVSASYFKPYDGNSKDRPYSVIYQFQPVTLDAVSGEVWPKGSQPVPVHDPLTEKPLGDAPQQGQSLTQDQAVEAVKAAFPLPENAVLQNVSYTEGMNYPSMKVEGTWNINWTVPASKEDSETKDTKIMPPYSPNIYASVNASTGEVRNFNRNSYYYPPTSADLKEYKVTFEDAKAKAIEFVKKQVPYATHQLVPEYTDPAQMSDEAQKYTSIYNFNFRRTVNGLSTNAENVNLGIDRKTGEVVNYYSSLIMETYPDLKEQIIPEAKALEQWLSAYSLELQYMPNTAGGYYPYGGMYMGKYSLAMASGDIPSGEKKTGPYKLVYAVTPKSQSIYNIAMDAVTGDWINMSNGQKTVLGKVQAKDTEGHWAARELNLMVEYNALELEDGKVNPDKTATRGELIKMLLTAMNGGYFYAAYDSGRAASFSDVKSGSSLFAYVENAVDRGLIDRNPEGSFNPDQPMTREEMAQLIVRALGYNGLAKNADLFKLNVSDAGDITYKGHAALVLGLGIMNAKNGAFVPKGEVTRADAAVSFFRFLEQRSVLQPQPMYY